MNKFNNVFYDVYQIGTAFNNQGVEIFIKRFDDKKKAKHYAKNSNVVADGSKFAVKKTIEKGGE